MCRNMYSIGFFILARTPVNPHLSAAFVHYLQPNFFKCAQSSLMDLIDLIGGEYPQFFLNHFNIRTPLVNVWLLFK